VRNGAPRSVAKGRCGMTNEATPAILLECNKFNFNYVKLLIKVFTFLSIVKVIR